MASTDAVVVVVKRDNADTSVHASNRCRSRVMILLIGRKEKVANKQTSKHSLRGHKRLSPSLIGHPGHRRRGRPQNLGRSRSLVQRELLPVDLFKPYSTRSQVPSSSTHLHAHTAARLETAQFLVVPLAIG